MKNRIRFISLLLALTLCIPFGAACKKKEEESTDPPDTDTSDSQGDTIEHPSENESGAESETDRIETGPLLEGKNALLIENADQLKNGVNASFNTAERKEMTFENLEMSLEYALSTEQEQLVKSLKNKAGKSYLENTMDVFVKMKNGNTYFASDSTIRTTANIYRFGYYFYEMRFEEQTFTGSYSEDEVYHFDLLKAAPNSDTKLLSGKKLPMELRNAPNAQDPYIIFGQSLGLSTDEYRLLQVTMKADSKVTGTQVFLVAGSQTGFNSTQRIEFQISTDNEYHTYTIPIGNAADYTGKLNGIRLDISGGGATYTIKEVKLLPAAPKDSPAELSLRRSFMTYSDKLHHVIQIAATQKTENIAEIGMLTELRADTVAKLIVKDRNGTHESLNGVDWSSAEYVGFDIKEAGIFGYILPFDGKGGKIKVTLEADTYRIIQTMIPEGNVISPSLQGTDNANDFYMGQRIYTDASHEFTEFLKEAECERNPLNSTQITVEQDYSTDAAYIGYDSLRGIYKFSLAGNIGGFGIPYYQEPNKHYRLSFDVKGDQYDRSIYVLAHTKSGNLETAILLDENDVMLPLPIEVGKNFSEPTGERNLYNLDDVPYGEAIFPMVIKAESEDNTYTLLNLYQLWGKYPLKQISWIQYSAPYYHLSTGVIETNCILPWFSTKGVIKGLNTLPDFRSMSAPFWKTQPQHNSCGSHYWLRYTDADGSYSASENYRNTIDSYGPTYADVQMDYMSDDGRIKLSYVHTEMPQTDENRTYYEMCYEVLEDISFKDFSRDFKFYAVGDNDPTGLYQQIGYLNEKNESVVVNVPDKPTQYVLGDKSPYFSYFNMKDYTSTSAEGYSNVAFLIYNYEIVIGGKKSDARFVINYEDSGMISVSLQLGEVTLKKGDTISINAILLPWGSQESDYSGSAPDKNVRDVRTNTLLNPLKVTADADCTVIDSVYVPKVRSENGESAEFTLTGGENNVAVRVYGLEKMTVPVIYEKIDGKWVEYVVSSAKTPDQNGDAHAYDGYGIHYDGDGTFSYSFVTTMEEGKPRTFKLVADGNYKKWEKEPVKASTGVDNLKVYTDPQEIADLAGAAMVSNKFIGKYEVMEDNSFIRLYGAGPDGSYEGYATVYTAPVDTVSGQYAVLRYRIPESNKESIANFEFYTSTVSSSASRDNGIAVPAVEADGEWHVLVVDLSKVTKENYDQHFKQDANGKYKAQFLRVDFFTQKMSPESYIDIAYVGMDDILNVIRNLNKDISYLTLVEGDEKYMLMTGSGEKLPFTSGAPAIPSQMIHPDSAYKRTDLVYSGYIDGVNGKALGGGFHFKADAVVINLSENAIADDSIANPSTHKGTFVVLSGWLAVQGGVEKYVWSTDGITWQDASMYNRTELNTAGEAILTAATNRIGGQYTFTAADAGNGSFQGITMPRGIAADLSDYIGQSVNVIFAAIPKNAPDTLCPIVCIANVKVTEQGHDLPKK